MKKEVLIIAEAGVNHNGDINLAKQLVEAASCAGADLVKFQTFDANRLVTRDAVKADYQTSQAKNVETQYDMLKGLQLTKAMHHQLISHCASFNIGFLSTGFDIESINFLGEIGQNLFKIPSGEITNLPYLRHIGQLAQPVILSTGMASMGDIEIAIDVLEKSGTNRDKITVLHCTTEYPTPMQEVNLLAMNSIKKAFNVSVGYSDHTRGIEIAGAAVALGAAIIEKHLTLDRKLSGPDHYASIEPKEFKSMVQSIRNVEVALGDGVKRLTPSEERNRPIVRKSLVAKRPILAGEKFTEQNMEAKRPGTGVSPMLWDYAIGRVAIRNFETDDLLDL